MGNATNKVRAALDASKTWAQFLATAIGDGTVNDLFGTAKVDQNPGLVSQVPFGQVNAELMNLIDDAIQVFYEDNSGGAGTSLLDWKNSVRAATTAALPANTLTNGVLLADANGALAAQDGVTLALGEELLVKNEGGGTSAKNGPYTVTDLGSGSTQWELTRRTDADGDTEVTARMTIPVSEGTLNAGKNWTLSTADPITVDTTALTFVRPDISTLSEVLAEGNVMLHGQSIVGEDDGNGTDGGDVVQAPGASTTSGGDAGISRITTVTGAAGSGAGAGGTGSRISHLTGDGGTGGATGNGGNGGYATRHGGDGGAGGATSGNGGNGGECRDTGGTGGNATTSGTGGTGGDSLGNAGNGGTGAGSGAGGMGGLSSNTGGHGGAGGATGTGGTGGAAQSIAGDGGAGGATSGAGGAGGAWSGDAGAGGDAATEGLGGTGGSAVVQAGDGGDAATATAQNQNGGAPGTAKVVAGDAGTGTGTHYQKGGNLELITGIGTSSTSADDGDVVVRSGGTSGTIRWRFIEGLDLVPETHAQGTVGSQSKYVEEVNAKAYYGGTLITFKPGQAEPPSTGYATVDERNGYPCLDFADSGDEKTRFSTMMPSTYRGAFTINVTLVWAATSATTGDVKWDVEFDTVTPETDDLDSTSYAAAQSSGGVTCPSTSGHIKSTTIAVTSAQADNMAVGDFFRLRVTRDTTDAADTMTGDAELYAVILEEV